MGYDQACVLAPACGLDQSVCCLFCLVQACRWGPWLLQGEDARHRPDAQLSYTQTKGSKRTNWNALCMWRLTRGLSPPLLRMPGCPCHRPTCHESVRGCSSDPCPTSPTVPVPQADMSKSRGCHSHHNSLAANAAANAAAAVAAGGASANGGEVKPAYKLTGETGSYR